MAGAPGRPQKTARKCRKTLTTPSVAAITDNAPSSPSHSEAVHKEFDAQGIDLINQVLPDECLAAVFEKLGSHSDHINCQLVCERWQAVERVARSEALLKSEKELLRVLSTYQNLRKIAIAANRCAISNDLTDGGLTTLGRSCSRLEELVLSGSYSITDAGLVSLAQGCTLLKTLSIEDCHNGTDAGLGSIGQHCKRLENLVMRFCPNFTSKGFVELAEGCNNLVSISITNCADFGTEALKAVGLHCHKLQTLLLADCPAVDDGAIWALAAHCKTLEHLYIKGVASPLILGLPALLEACANLRTIQFVRCDGLTGQALAAIAGCNCLSALELLNVDRCRGHESVFMATILRKCPRLHHLVLRGLPTVDDIGLARLATAGAPFLKELSLEGCSRVGSMGVTALATTSPSLRSLNINGCLLINDKVLEILPVLCPKLEMIDMAACPFITDVGVFSIVSRCRHLKDLVVERLKVSSDTQWVAKDMGCTLLLPIGM